MEKKMSKTKVNWVITDNNITVNYSGQTHIVSREDKLADQLIKALKENNLDQIPDLVSASKRIEKFGRGNFVVRDGEILVNGMVVPTALGKKILRFSEEGLPYQPLVKFAENLQNNPSYRAVNELFQFLEKNDHPITEGGCFIAYKRVRHDFKDIYTGTIDNSVGATPKMPRNLVNEDPNQTCSDGLHVANWDYAHTKYSSVANDVMLEVEVNPADVVAVPIDYDQSKMRVCGYRVLGVVDHEHSTETSIRVVDQKKYDDFLGDDQRETMCVDCDEYRCCDRITGQCKDCFEPDSEKVEEKSCESCGDFIDTCCPSDKLCCDCADSDACSNCGEEFCDGECEDGCEACGEPDCYGECEDEDDNNYPFDSEL
jgi:hypothetical protein